MNQNINAEREALIEKLIKTNYTINLFQELAIFFLTFSSYAMLYKRFDIILAILVLTSLFSCAYCLYRIRVIKALKHLLSLNYSIGFLLFFSIFLYSIIQLN